MSENIDFMCCFCGESVDFNSAVHIIIMPNMDSEEKQGLCSHKSCLNRLLHKDIPVHPDLLSDDKKI
jgi:hypothetical protein